MSKEKIFWLYVSSAISLVNEYSGETDELLSELKQQAKDSGIKWNNQIANKKWWRSHEWVMENLV